MAKVTLRNLAKTYEGATAGTIEGLNLDIADKEFLVLVGPSGCGKSTTLRMVAGLEDPTGGEIHIGEKRVDGLDPRDRDIAMVFQNYALYPHMTVAENMSFGLRLAGTPKAEIRRKVEEAAKVLGIADYLTRRPKALSGGQRQRVAMGRAIVREPKVFLFDEPLSNLDAQLRGQMRAEIRWLHNRLQATTIYVTHDQVEAMTLADRIVVLKGGKIEQQGTPQELYDRPATRFVAGFLGAPQMNFLKARVTSDMLDLGEGLVIPVPPGHAPLREGQAVDLGIRPEHFIADPGDGPAIAATSQMNEVLGAATLVHFTHAGQSCTALLPPRATPTLNAAFRLGLPADQISLFDAETGLAL